MVTAAALLRARWPVLATVPAALAWLCMRTDLGIAPRTLDAYARGLSEYLAFCAALRIDSLSAGREHVARFVRHLTERSSRHAGAVCCSVRPCLSNATVQQRLTAVRLFYDHLVEDGLRDTNPVGRGRYAPNARPHYAQCEGVVTGCEYERPEPTRGAFGSWPAAKQRKASAQWDAKSCRGCGDHMRLRSCHSYL